MNLLTKVAICVGAVAVIGGGTATAVAAATHTSKPAQCSAHVGKVVQAQDAYTTCMQDGKTYHADSTACVGDNQYVSFGPWYGGQVTEPAAKKLIPFEMVDPGSCAVTVS